MKQKNSVKPAFLKMAILLAVVFGLPFFYLKDKALAIDCDAITDKSLEDKCEVLEKKAKEYRNVIEIKNKQQNTLEKQLLLIDIEQRKNQTELQKTKTKAAELSQQIIDLEKEISYKENLVKYQKAILVGLMQSHYEYNQSGVLKVALSDQAFSDFFDQSDYVAQASGSVNEALHIIQEARVSLQKEYDEVRRKKEESEQVKSQLENKNLDLQKNETQKQVLLSKTQGEEKKYNELLDKVEQQQQEIYAEIQQIESDKAGLDLGPLPPTKSGLLAYPVNPVRITQGYGKTSFSKHYVSGLHNGIDFGIKYGKIYAADSGKVLLTGNNGKYAYGKWVAIDHGNGLVTLYGHFSKVSVSKGDSVKGGDILGISGNTGFSTGPHLHFSVFAKKTFELVESTKIPGLMLPTGASLNPKKYL